MGLKDERREIDLSAFRCIRDDVMPLAINEFPAAPECGGTQCAVVKMRTTRAMKLARSYPGVSLLHRRSDSSRSRCGSVDQHSFRPMQTSDQGRWLGWLV